MHHLRVKQFHYPQKMLQIKKQFRCRACNEIGHNECKMYETRITKQNEKLKCIKETPAKLKAPLNKTHPLKIQLALQNERIKNKQFEQEIAKLQREIQTQSFEISKNLSEDVQNVLNNNSEKLTS